MAARFAGKFDRALLLHLAAAEVYYALNTFESLPWGRYPEEVKLRWGPAMALGDVGRARIRGHDLQFYRSTLDEVRERTLFEFKKRDDDWFMSVDFTWSWGPTNNFCKWFHVCEHESHHLGQIDLIIKALPSRNTAECRDAQRSRQRARPSRTALGVAVRRASHQIYDSPPLVLNDPVAVPILGSTYQRQLAEAGTAINEKSSIAVRAWVLARSRLVEDELAKAVDAGTRQYVVFGAGLDTFAFRNPYPHLDVFEVDHPATQQWKLELVALSGLTKPRSLHYVAVDFETQSLREQLEGAGLDFATPTIFAMLGVVVYLTSQAFRSTLEFVSSFPAGSGIIFDYALPRHALPSDEVDARDELAARVASAGEPFQLFFTPAEVRSELTAFEDITDIEATELNRRYFSDRVDQLNLHRRSGHIVSAWRRR